MVMKTSPFRLVTFCIGCGIALFNLNTAFADAREIEVTVQLSAKPKPIEATGMILSTSSSKQFPKARIEMIGDKLYAISFKIPENAVKSDTLASAYAIDENGKTSFSSVVPVMTAQEGLSLGNIPSCKDENIDKVATITNLGTLRQLIDVRNQRIEIIRTKMRQSLNNILLEKMRKYEEAFGLPHAEPLSVELPPMELFERLSRIQNAVAKYKKFKQ